jgi:hypothetical protein
MFAIGRYPAGARVDAEERLRRLDQMIRNPRQPHIPVYVDLYNLGTTVLIDDYMEVERFEARPSLEVTAPMKLIQQWVQDYILRCRWEFAWMLARLMYMGSLEPVDMNMFQWQGLPGISRLWIWRDGYLLPTPLDGPVKSILANWFSLSGGFYAPGGEVLDADVNAFLDDWASPNSPLVTNSLEGGGDAYDVLDVIAKSFHDPLAYPRISLTDLHRECKAPEARRVGDVWYQREVPLCRATPFQKGKGGLIPVGTPWDIEWLQNQKEKVPPRLLLMVAALRHEC